LLGRRDMDSLVERIVAAVEAINDPLCEKCLIEQLRADHRAVAEAMSGVAKLDDFQFRTECSRCGARWPALVVGRNAAP
jgi:ribosomal protein L40E